MGTDEPRVALVTGAGGVVAKAIVERLQADGFRVAGLDDDGAAGDLAIAVDVTDRDQVVAAAERVTRELGPISVLVTAPYLYDAAPFGEMSAERWDRLLRMHLGGTTNACRRRARHGAQATRDRDRALVLAGVRRDRR